MPVRCCADTFKRFERQNPAYALTAFECPVKSKGRDDPAEGRDKEHSSYHYITVTSLPALLREAPVMMNVRKTERLVKHRPECLGINAGGVQQVTIPTVDNNILEFRIRNDPPCAFRYLDFESLLVAVPDEEQPMSAQQSKREAVFSS